MIQPGITSPLRPVITAFYAAAQAFALEKRSKTQRLQDLRHALVACGLRVASTSNPHVDLVVNDRVGVMVLPDGTSLDRAYCRQTRQMLITTAKTPDVVLLMVYTPHLRLARIDLPQLHENKIGERP